MVEIEGKEGGREEWGDTKARKGRKERKGKEAKAGKGRQRTQAKEGKTVSLEEKGHRGAEVGGPDSQNHQRKFEWEGISCNRCNHLLLGTSTALPHKAKHPHKFYTIIITTCTCLGSALYIVRHTFDGST